MSAYSERKDTLTLSLPLELYINEEVGQSHTPFKRPSIIKRAFRTGAQWLAIVLQSVLGRTLLVENKDAELAVFSAPVRHLFSYLADRRLVMGWTCVKGGFTGEESSYLCRVHAPALIHNGRRMCDDGHIVGSGVSNNPTEAMLKAEAELIERVAMFSWDPSDFFTASIKDMRAKKAKFISNIYYGDVTEVPEDKEFDWVEVRDIQNGSLSHVPATMIFLSHGRFFPDKDIFIDASSNGGAAHTELDQALSSAIYECLERDAFMLYWYSHLSPTQIDLGSIPNERAKALVASWHSFGVEAHLLDLKTEFNVATLALVLIYPARGAVYVQTASGSYPEEVLDKVFDDTVHHTVDRTSSGFTMNYDSIVWISERRSLWYGGTMRKHADFLVNNSDVRQWTEYRAQCQMPVEGESELSFIKNILQKNQLRTYWYEYHNDLAEYAGLRVVKVVAPELVPIHFTERKRHLNVPRLYTFAERMGYKNRPLRRDEMNLIPHPFL